MDFKFAAFVIISAQICTSLALPPCACTRNYRPVCGSDGKTYNNQCLLDCAAYQSKTDLTATKPGRCEESVPEPSGSGIEVEGCICTFDYTPVCGTDGQTYPNECALNCQNKRFNPLLKVDHFGPCVTPQEPECVCTLIYSPVCGSDGNTYANDCALNCATKKNSMLSIARRGSCDNSVKVVNNL